MRVVRLVLAWLLGPPILGLGMLCASLALAAHLGRTSLHWDVLTHFAPGYFVGSLVVLAAGLLLGGAARFVLWPVGLVGVAASALLMAPEYERPAAPTASADAPGALRLVQFNLWFNTQHLDRSLAWLEREDPDIAILEEPNDDARAWARSQRRWHVTCPGCEVIILSKRPPLPDPDGARLDGPVTRARFGDARGAFAVIGVHNAWPTDPEQPFQERRLARLIAEAGRARTIVAGDFNSTPWSFQRRAWDARFGLVRRTRALFTWPALQWERHYGIGLFPFLPIDQVYAGADWATVKVARGPRLGSDHYPVIVTLAPVARR